MGANSSKNSTKPTKQYKARVNHQKTEDLFDLGSVFPNGLYPASEQDDEDRIVRNLIITRKISPFYKGLSDAPEFVAMTTPTSSSTLSTECKTGRSRSSSRSKNNYDPCAERQKAYVEKMQQIERMLYNDAVECPICFLYYPANINYTRCCDQPICSECYVQIQRLTTSPSKHATCPFCMEENYGVLYKAPAWSEQL